MTGPVDERDVSCCPTCWRCEGCGSATGELQAVVQWSRDGQPYCLTLCEGCRLDDHPIQVRPRALRRYVGQHQGHLDAVADLQEIRAAKGAQR